MRKTFVRLLTRYQIIPHADQQQVYGNISASVCLFGSSSTLKHCVSKPTAIFGILKFNDFRRVRERKTCRTPLAGAHLRFSETGNVVRPLVREIAQAWKRHCSLLFSKRRNYSEAHKVT